MSGRPPRAGAVDDEYDDDDAGYDEEGAYGAGEEAAVEEGEEAAGDNGGEDGDERPETSGSGVAVEFIPAPEEKPLPPNYPMDIGGVAEYLSFTASSSPSSASATASAPSSSSASGTPATFVPGLHCPVAGEARNIYLDNGDPRIPKWLHYILNDDFPSLTYLIHPPPGAKIDLSGVAGDQKKKSSGSGDDEYTDDGESRTSSRPTSSRGGGGGGGGGDSYAGDSEGTGYGAAAAASMAEIEYHPNAKFTLVPNPEAAMTKWNLVPYELPEKRAGGRRPGSATSGGDPADGGGSEYSRGSGAVNSEGGAGGGAADGDEDDDANNKKPQAPVEDETEPGTVVVDALTLAAMFSPEALAMLIKERMKAYVIPGMEKHAAGEEGAEEDEDEEAAAERNRKRPPSLYTFWRWCEAYGGLGSDQCSPLQQLVKVCTAWQAEPEPEPEQKAQQKPSERHADESDADYDETAGGGYDDGDAEGDDNGKPKMTLAQRRRTFMDFDRVMDIVAAARTAGEAQQAEAVLRALLVDANVAPSGPVDFVSKALRNINTLHAYITLLECVPRSLVGPSWTEPVPLTEAEVAAYPEGAEDIPDEHPAKLSPRLWKFFEHIRRRLAKERGGKPLPKRPLVDVLKKMFTPSAEDLGVDAELVKPGPMIHTEPALQQQQQDVNPAANVDPLLFQGFDACRDYPPAQVCIYFSDVLLAALGRHEFGLQALEWLGGLKRAFPHPKWHAVGSSHVLAMSLGRMHEQCALVTVSQLLDPTWFAPCGRVALPGFLANVASDPSLRCLDTGAFRSGAVTSYFARHFCPVIVRRHSAALLATGGAKTADEAIQVILSRIESEFSALAAQFRDGPQRLADSFVKTVCDAHPEEEIAHKLDAIEAEAGRTALATTAMLRIAVDKKQLCAVHWLVRRGVARVEHDRGDVPVLEYCVESSNEEVLVSLAEKYADVEAPVLGGRGSILTEVQERAGFSDGIVRRIEAAVAEARNWRGADPTQELGIKIGSVVC